MNVNFFWNNLGVWGAGMRITNNVRSHGICHPPQAGMLLSPLRNEIFADSEVSSNIHRSKGIELAF